VLDVAYEVTLEQFSGPLDLLLHLIQKQELNIYDIPIAKITDQYLLYLEALDQMSLEIASEFIVMAATLLAIKSRMLLPRKAIQTSTEEVEEDPREELVRQLLEYQRCRWAASMLKEQESLRASIFSREPLDLRPFAPTDIAKVEGVTIWDLVDAFRKLYQRVPKEDKVAEIRGHVVRVEQMMDVLLERIARYRHTTFDVLLEFVKTRHEIVSAFLALLELVKDGFVRCSQSVPFAEIDVSLIYYSSLRDKL
jgi:segregation and condensation protein A